MAPYMTVVLDPMSDPWAGVEGRRLLSEVTGDPDRTPSLSRTAQDPW